MREILINVEEFESLKSRFETVFSRAFEAADYAHSAEYPFYQLFMVDMQRQRIHDKADDIRYIIQMIVDSFTSQDEELKKQAEQIRDVYIGPDRVGTVISIVDSLHNGPFGDGSGGGGFRGAGSSNGIISDIWDEISRLPADIMEGLRNCHDVAIWYDSLPDPVHKIVDKIGSVICNKIDNGGNLYTSLQMVHDVFSANTALEGAESLIDSFGKEAGMALGKKAASMGAGFGMGTVITTYCSMLGDYANGVIQSVSTAFNKNSTTGRIFRATGDFASKTVNDIRDGNWGSACLNSLKTIGTAVGGALVTAFDGIAEGTATIKNGMADTLDSVFDLFNWSGAKMFTEELRNDAREDQNFII